MEAVAQEMDRFVDLANKPNKNDRKLAKSAARLRALAQEQKADITPSPVLDEHKENYFRLMDIQARKAEDILATGGENYDMFLAEEEALIRENQAREQEVDKRMQQSGLIYPDSIYKP